MAPNTQLVNAVDLSPEEKEHALKMWERNEISDEELDEVMPGVRQSASNIQATEIEKEAAKQPIPPDWGGYKRAIAETIIPTAGDIIKSTPIGAATSGVLNVATQAGADILQDRPTPYTETYKKIKEGNISEIPGKELVKTAGIDLAAGAIPSFAGRALSRLTKTKTPFTEKKPEVFTPEMAEEAQIRRETGLPEMDVSLQEKQPLSGEIRNIQNVKSAVRADEPLTQRYESKAAQLEGKIREGIPESKPINPVQRQRLDNMVKEADHVARMAKSEFGDMVYSDMRESGIKLGKRIEEVENSFYKDLIDPETIIEAKNLSSEIKNPDIKGVLKNLYPNPIQKIAMPDGSTVSMAEAKKMKINQDYIDKNLIEDLEGGAEKVGDLIEAKKKIGKLFDKYRGVIGTTDLFELGKAYGFLKDSIARDARMDTITRREYDLANAAYSDIKNFDAKVLAPINLGSEKDYSGEEIKKGLKILSGSEVVADKILKDVSGNEKLYNQMIYGLEKNNVISPERSKKLLSYSSVQDIKPEIEASKNIIDDLVEDPIKFQRAQKFFEERGDKTLIEDIKKQYIDKKFTSASKNNNFVEFFNNYNKLSDETKSMLFKNKKMYDQAAKDFDRLMEVLPRGSNTPPTVAEEMLRNSPFNIKTWPIIRRFFAVEYSEAARIRQMITDYKRYNAITREGRFTGENIIPTAPFRAIGTGAESILRAMGEK